MTLNEYIYSGNAHYECELYVDGIKSNIDVNSITVSGTDSSVYVPFGNVFSRYITLNINGNMLDPGQQVFVRLIPDGFDAIDIGAFYVQGDPTANGGSYTFTAHDKLIYADIPVDFVELPQPSFPEDPGEEYDELISASLFYILEESAKYLGLECDFPEENALWQAAQSRGTSMLIPIQRYVRKKLENEGNPFWANGQYIINDLGKLSAKSNMQTVGLITGTNFVVEARLENGKVVETLKACPVFSEGIQDDDGSYITLDESSVVYAENEIEKKITNIVGTVTTKYKKYDFTILTTGEAAEGQTQELNYSEEECVDTYSASQEGTMELELPITLASAGNQSIIDSIHYAVDHVRLFGKSFYRYSVSMVGDPRVRNGYIIQFAGGYKYYVGNITLNYDGGLKMDISSGSSENTSISMGSAGIASILEKVKGIELNLNNTEKNAMSVEELNARVASFEYMKVDELEASVANIGSLTADSAIIQNIQAVALNADAIKAAVADIDVLTVSQADVKYASIDSLDALQGSFNTLNAKAITTDNLSAKTAELGYLTATQADVKYASIDMANVSTASIGTVLAKVGLITSATIESGHVTGYLDSVSINANAIKAGTLSVDRLVINGTTNSIIYALNNAGDLTSTHCDTLDGGLLTKRTVTADHIVAGTITANEIAAGTITAAKIASGTITATQIASGTITATQIKSGTITADKINLTDLFSKNITASNFNITGGSIKVTTSSDTVNFISLTGTNYSTIVKSGGLLSSVTQSGNATKTAIRADVIEIDDKYGDTIFAATINDRNGSSITLGANVSIATGTQNTSISIGTSSKQLDALYAKKVYLYGSNTISSSSVDAVTGKDVYNYASPKAGSSSLTTCSKGTFGNACTRAYSTAASSIASGGAYLPTGGAIYSYINNNLYSRLVDGHLSFKWIADTDGWAKLYIYIDTVLVAKIRQGTGL